MLVTSSEMKWEDNLKEKRSSHAQELFWIAILFLLSLSNFEHFCFLRSLSHPQTCTFILICLILSQDTDKIFVIGGAQLYKASCCDSFILFPHLFSVSLFCFCSPLSPTLSLFTSVLCSYFSSMQQEAMESPFLETIHLTRVHADPLCDVFLPPIPPRFKAVGSTQV